MKKIWMFSLAVTMLAVSCTKDKGQNQAGVFKGPEVAMHHGKAWTFAQLSSDGKPERIGVTIDNDALNSVPIGHDNGGGGGHTHDDNVVLKFHEKANSILFKHVWLNWNPAGHPPANVYTKPHFDIHYYTTTNEERAAYVEPAKLNADPAAGYLPPLHVGADPVPTMGKHWVDVTSPELNPNNPQPFTQTFIYGSYDSKVVFYEPMITLDFLKATNNFERSIPQPAKFQKTGYYPTKMRVQKQGNAVSIILEDFVYRTAS
jgi:Domain of unknown function (DUF5602)